MSSSSLKTQNQTPPPTLGENGIMKKKFSTLTKEIEDQRDEVKDLLDREKELYSDIKTLEHAIADHKTHIRTKDEVIGEKEKRIFELKKKNQELEKFKFVLDFNIKELKREIDPRAEASQAMRCQIAEMDVELEDFHKSNAQLDVLIGSLRQKIDDMQREIKCERKQLADQKGLQRRFRCDLHLVMDHIQNPKELEVKMKKILQEYWKTSEDAPASSSQRASGFKPASSTRATISSHEQPVVFEYQRQKDYLEKSLLALQAKYETEVSVEKQASVDQREQNLSLIGEITDIRLCLQHKKAQVQTLRAAMGSQKLLASNNKSTTQSPPVVSKTTPQQKSKQQNPKARDQAIMWTQEKLMQQHEYMEYMTTQIRQYEQLIQKDLQSRSAECTTTSSIIANNGIDG